MNRLDLTSIACFAEAARTLNFRSASAAMGLSPAAFSERVRRLEDDLGARLFERTTRRVRLTRAGTRLLPVAHETLESARRCAAAVAGEGEASPFMLTIGTRFELGMSWLVPSLGVLKEKRPEREIHLAFGVGPDLVARMRSGLIDAVITSSRLTERDLETMPLHPESYVFVGSPALLERVPLTRAADAVRHTVIDATPDLPLLRYHLDARGGGPPLVFGARTCMGTIGAMRHQVLAEVGVAVLPEYYVHQDLADGRLVRIFPDVVPVSDTFRLVWRLGNPLAAEIHALGEVLRSIPLR